eukprot:2043832-Pyramimonas_sp.AAC.1
MQTLEDQDPYFLLASPDCKMFTNLKKLSEGKYKDPEERARLEEEGLEMLHFTVDACLDQIRRGRWFLHEYPWTATSWKGEWVQWLASQPG